MKIVAISGWKQSGKDTASDHLVKYHGFKRVAFADRLKDMAAAEYEVPRENFDNPAFKERPILRLPVDPQDSFSRMIAEGMIGEFRSSQGVRPYAFSYRNGEFYGLINDTIDMIDLNIAVRVYWTPRALAIFKGSGNRSVTSSYWVKTAVDQMSKDPDGLYVISDIRFKSEANQLIQFAGKENVTIIRVARFTECLSTDASERDMDDYPFDIMVSNRGTKQEYLENIEESLGLTSQAFGEEFESPPSVLVLRRGESL